MPIYEYECRDCGKLTELLESVDAGTDGRRCRFCGSASLERALSRGVSSRMKPILGAQGGRTCCGRQERCETPPCSSGRSCCE